MFNSTSPIHLGITGYNAAGKGEVTDYLTQLGFTYLSLSDFLRKHARDHEIEPSRANLTSLGQSLRQKHGPGFLADWAVKSMSEGMQDHTNKRFVIDSIRHPEEIKILKKTLSSFYLLGITANVALRYERSKQRGRNENAHTLEEFVQREAMETSDNEHAQQLHRCMALTDHTLVNDKDKDHLYAQLDAWMHSLSDTKR